jgi:mRNA interferase MazF
MVILRGTVWWVELPEPMKSEPGYRRPVIVVQSNPFNRSRIHTVVSVILSSNARLAAAPGNVRVTAKESGLPRDSVANVSQVVTLDRRFFTEPCGRLSPRTMDALDSGLRLVLGL